MTFINSHLPDWWRKSWLLNGRSTWSGSRFCPSQQYSGRILSPDGCRTHRRPSRSCPRGRRAATPWPCRLVGCFSKNGGITGCCEQQHHGHRQKSLNKPVFHKFFLPPKKVMNYWNETIAIHQYGQNLYEYWSIWNTAKKPVQKRWNFRELFRTGGKGQMLKRQIYCWKEDWKRSLVGRPFRGWAM